MCASMSWTTGLHPRTRDVNYILVPAKLQCRFFEFGQPIISSPDKNMFGSYTDSCYTPFNTSATSFLGSQPTPQASNELQASTQQKHVSAATAPRLITYYSIMHTITLSHCSHERPNTQGRSENAVAIRIFEVRSDELDLATGPAAVPDHLLA